MTLGVVGPFWYAAGATVQILLFGVMAVQIKRRAWTSHTIAEIIRARWGQTCHIIFLYFFLLTNLCVSSMLVLGGAAVIHVLTGIDINIASFLMPLSTVFYTAAGGLKASFISAYIHVILVLALMCTFVFQVYATSTELGSTEAVYDRLTRVVHLSAQTCQDFGYTSTQTCGPIKGNLHGSYVTFWSSGGLMFGVANIVGCFGCVFLDQAYYNTAIACKPSTTSRGFMLGGICWFAIPFALGEDWGMV